MPKTTHPLLPATVPNQNPATITATAHEVVFTIGPRTVSWYHSGRASTAEAFALDVARAVAASVVDDLIAALSPDLVPVATHEVAEQEWLRLQERMHDYAASYMCNSDSCTTAVLMSRAVVTSSVESTRAAPTRSVACVLHKGALDMAAAILRARAVRW